MVKRVGNIRFEDEELKNILVFALFFRVALDIVGPFLETKTRNKFILVAIDDYSKWCEAKVVLDHGVKTIARFLENDIVCTYGVPKFIFTDNGGAVKFDVICKDYRSFINIPFFNGPNVTK
jgi:hypothetical protein